MNGFRIPEAEFRQIWDASDGDRPMKPRVFPGSQMFTTILTGNNPYSETVDVLAERQAKAFEVGVPAARVIRLRGAHYIFLSDEPGVLREMRAFLASLR